MYLTLLELVKVPKFTELGKVQQGPMKLDIFGRSLFESDEA